MKRFLKSKKGLALLATIAVAALASGAYAFLTTGGSGAGSATAGSTTNNLVIGTGTKAANPVSVGSGLLPGQSVGVSYSIYNPNTFSVNVASVSASSIVQSNATCDASPLAGDFSYVDGAGADGITIGPGATSATFTGTLSESDDATNNQDSCESPNSTTLSLTSS